MPDFEAIFTSGPSSEPWTEAIAPWTDPPLGNRPSRINPVANRPHLRRLTEPPSVVVVTARVDGDLAPLDADLGGRLFVAWLAEYPGSSPPPVTSPTGQSSRQMFTPTEPGHYTLVMRRAGGGGVILHVDVVVT